MGMFSSIAKVAATVAKAPLKVVGGGVSLAFKKPSLSAVTAAGKVIDAAQGAIGTPAQQRSAKRIVAHTIKQARAGDPEAKNGVKAMETAQKAKALVAARMGGRATAARRRASVVNTTGTAQEGWHISRGGEIRVLNGG